MSEAELVESAGIFYALVADMLTLYLSATTGFLIVAYVVGSKLTRLQLTVISGLYLIFALTSTYLAVGYGVRGVGYMLLVKDMNHPVTVYANNVVPVALSLTLLGGVLACLVFMWQVRHPKTE